MLSRIAENIFWMGRYVERAENAARLVDVNYFALMEAPLVSGAPDLVTEQWAPLLAATGQESGFREHFERADASTVPHWLALDRRNPGSIRSSLATARENARALRDRISSEMWETLNTAYLQLVIDAPTDLDREEDALHAFCVAVRDASHLFFGIADATLPRDLGWSFLRAGQYLERADSTLRTLLVRYREARGEAPVAEGVAAHRAGALLRSLSAYEAYLKSHHAGFDARQIASFLLQDPWFPRSVLFCAAALHAALRELAPHNPEASRDTVRRAGWFEARLRYLPVATRVLDDHDPSVEDLMGELAELAEALGEAYFGHSA